MMKFKFTILVALLSLTVTSAHAYTFRFMLQKEPIHTDMAIKAWQCVMEHPDANEFDCDNYIPSEKLPNELVVNNNPLTLNQSDIYYASIWADDPVRELQKRKLHKVALWTFRLIGDKCADLKDGLPDGVRCTAHYGNMQFMHSMEHESNLSPKETQQAILDWAEFSYKVALNEKDANGDYFTEQKHCEYFNEENPSKFQKSMLPGGPTGFPCDDGDTEIPWTLGTIFSFNCWLRSSTCWEYSGLNDPRTRKAALGAILHMIQDSYAKGHTSRGNDVQAAINTMECAPIEQFQNYSIQNHETHSEGDKYPILSDNCASSEIHGPVTATAEIIRLFSQDKSPAVVKQYLADHVFVLAADDKLRGAGATDLMTTE